MGEGRGMQRPIRAQVSGCWRALALNLEEQRTWALSRNGGQKELLIPAIKQCVLAVDVENERMTVWIMPGLEDL